MIPVYFNSDAKDPVHLAEINIPFFYNYVKEWGHSPCYSEFWVGQTLRNFIIGFLTYAAGKDNSLLSAKAERLLRIYNSLLMRLMGDRLTTEILSYESQ
jgi:hypothetical protein